MEKENNGPEKTQAQLSAEIVALKKRILELESAPKGHKNDLAYFNERLVEEAARSTRYKYEFSILLFEIDNIELFSKKCGAAAAG